MPLGTHRWKSTAMPICTAKPAVDPVDIDLGQGGDIPASGQIRIRPSFPCRSLVLFASLLDERQRRLFARPRSAQVRVGRRPAHRPTARHRPVDGRRRPAATRRARRRDRPGAARRRRASADGKKTPEVIAHIEALMDHETAGDPLSGLKWTRRTTAKVAAELGKLGTDQHIDSERHPTRQLQGFRRVTTRATATDHAGVRGEQRRQVEAIGERQTSEQSLSSNVRRVSGQEDGVRLERFVIQVDGRLLLSMSARHDGQLRLDRLDRDHPGFRDVFQAILTVGTTTQQIQDDDLERLGEVLDGVVPGITAEYPCVKRAGSRGEVGEPGSPARFGKGRFWRVWRTGCSSISGLLVQDLRLPAPMESADPHLIRSTGFVPRGPFRFSGSRSDLFAITPCRTLRNLQRTGQCTHWPDDFVRPQSAPSRRERRVARRAVAKRRRRKAP